MRKIIICYLFYETIVFLSKDVNRLYFEKSLFLLLVKIKAPVNILFDFRVDNVDELLQQRFGVDSNVLGLTGTWTFQINFLCLLHQCNNMSK